MNSVKHLVIILLALSVPLFSEVVSVELQRKQEKSARHYEGVVHRALARHYDEETFLVDARVTIDSVLTTVKQRLVLDPEIRQLPGLPVLPGELYEKPTDTIVSREKWQYTLGSVQVAIMVDSTYRFDRDFDFIRNLITMVANINTQKGDGITIKRMNFPRSALAIENRRRADSLGQIALEDSLRRARYADSLRSGASVHASSPTFGLTFWLLLLLILLLLLLMSLVWRQSKSERRITIADNSEIRDTLDTIISQIGTIKQGSKGHEPDVEEVQKAIRKLRSFVVHAFIGNPQRATYLLVQWIHQGDEGIIHVAKLILAVDGELLAMVKPHLERTIYKQVEWHIIHGDVSLDNQEEILKLFKRDYGLIAKESGDAGEEDLFHFLGQLTDEQLLHIIKDEEEGVQALILSQLSGAKSAQILQRFDGVLRTRILVAMGKISSIPVSVYKAIADKISRKALAVSTMRSVTADGTEAALKVISSLPVAEQDGYIHSITEADMELARRIRRFWVTFAELPALSPQVLRRVLQNVEREALVIALVGVTDAFRDALLKHLPERMQEMVLSSIASRQDSTPSDIERARKGLLSEVEKELRQTGGREV